MELEIIDEEKLIELYEESLNEQGDIIIGNLSYLPSEVQYNRMIEQTASELATCTDTVCDACQLYKELCTCQLDHRADMMQEK